MAPDAPKGSSKNSKSKKKKKVIKPKLTAEQRKTNKLKADHTRTVRAVFRNTGFARASEIAGENVSFLDRDGEFDDAFLLENLLILVEYTTTQSAGVSDHLKPKKILFRKVVDNSIDFIAYLKGKFPAFAGRLGSTYHEDRMMVRIVYCSRYNFDEQIKSIVDEPVYFDYPILKYFEKISSAIKLSSQHELLEFLSVDPLEVGTAGRFGKTEAGEAYPGSLLPEEASGFPKGYKVVSFYADAAALLQRAFVLRHKGWRGSQQAYQRMVIPSKIETIRAALREKGQVAVNNVIATLPHDVKPVGSDGHTIDVTTLKRTAPVKISLPLRPNSIGLIDGQHRLFAYYRSEKDDPRIALLRDQQNLLVTGIIYPQNMAEAEAERFEASLFLSINSNQSSAPPELRQEIEVLLNPFSPTAISKQVMGGIAATGPLSEHVERYFYDKGKLKTSSIVSFGLGPLLKLSGEDSIFSAFSHPEKDGIAKCTSTAALTAYLQQAISTINVFLGAVRVNVRKERWTSDRNIPDRLITVTYVNSFLITLRMLLQADRPLDFENLSRNLAGFDAFDTKPFSSSQYNRMAEAIFHKHFG